MTYIQNVANGYKKVWSSTGPLSIGRLGTWTRIKLGTIKAIDLLAVPMCPNGRKLERLRNEIFVHNLKLPNMETILTGLRPFLDADKKPGLYESDFITSPHSHLINLTDPLGQKAMLAGTVKSHPQFISSNGQLLPTNNKSIERSLIESLPKHLQPYANLGILSRYKIPKINRKKAGRYAPSDQMVEEKTRFALEMGWLNPKRDLVIMDSGGAHSIAAARALAQKGYFVIPHFNSQTGSHCTENVAALAFFAHELAELNRITQQNNPNAPWALILVL